MWKKNKPSLNNQIPTHSTDFKGLLRYITQLARHKLGYPVSLLTYLGVVNNKILGIQPDSLANVLLNNVGDPFKDSETSLMEVKKHERELIKILERYYGMPEDTLRGYVTTGGTEGNFASMWWSKRYMINCALDDLIKIDNTIKLQTAEEQELFAVLAKIPLTEYQERATILQKIIDHSKAIAANKNIQQQYLTPTIFFCKGHTHYSIPKIAEVLRLNIRPVMPKEDGRIDLDNLKKELILHLGAYPHSSIILIANIGTTITGAVDDVPAMKKILDDLNPKPNYTIHMDGALTGFVLPILNPFGEVQDYFTTLGVNTLAVSAHKYPGLSQPCGIILATRKFFEKAFEKSERSVDYVGNILDVTITGSRSGLNVLMFYNALITLELHKNNDKLRNMVAENLENAKYLCDKLISLYGADKVSYPYHFNIMFPKPSLEIAKKYQLMLTGDNATICVLTNVSKELIDMFIKDLQLENKKNIELSSIGPSL
jgi:histidine decarboxylase